MSRSSKGKLGKPHIWRSTPWKYTCKMDDCPIIANAATIPQVIEQWLRSYAFWKERQ